VIKFSVWVLSKQVMVIVLISLFLIYLGTYMLSFRKILKELATYFSSIAEK
jgi:hypothetical protein